MVNEGTSTPFDEIADVRQQLAETRYIDQAIVDEFVRAAEVLRRERDAADDRLAAGDLDDELELAIKLADRSEAASELLERLVDRAWDVVHRCARCGTEHEWFERCAPVPTRTAIRWGLFAWTGSPVWLQRWCAHEAAMGADFRRFVRRSMSEHGFQPPT